MVYDDKNIVDFTEGYYRLHSQPGISGISPVRYASGYLHEIEKTAGDESTPIPMHFYSKSGVNGTFNGDLNPLKSDYTQTAATRGDIPVPSTETDPSTIFRVVNGDAITNRTISNVTMSTQGLNVIQNKMGTGTATTYRLIDIGGGVVVLVNTTSGTNYLNFTQTGNIYDLKFSDADASRMDDVKWCMEPANNMGLTVATNKGGDDYYYATFCAPFDVLLPNDDGETKTYYAYICKKWHNDGVNPVPVPKRTIGETTYAEGKFVPAGTPVIIRTSDESGSIKLALPSDGPASSLTGNIFSGSYLEQLLGDGSDVYTLGLPYNSGISEAGNYEDTGELISTPPIDQAKNGVGFYINANPNKELDPTKAGWYRNNRYVLHNKIYYREGATPGAYARTMTRAVEFVPLIFDDLYEDNQNGGNGDMMPSQTLVGDGCVYDMQGRRVANAEQVLDGTWKQRVAPGIYIINGKKVSIR